MHPSTPAEDADDVFLIPGIPLTQRQLPSTLPHEPSEPSPSQRQPAQNGADLIEAFQQAAPSALYRADMSDEQIEGLIEDIVREEGFIEFCTKVHRMWRARALGTVQSSR